MGTKMRRLSLLMFLGFLCRGYENARSVIRSPLLEDGIPLTREKPVDAIERPGPKSYLFDLKSGEYFRLSLRKTGTGLSLSLRQPGGMLLRFAGCAEDGPLLISNIASTPGQYTATINPCGAAPP